MWIIFVAIWIKCNESILMHKHIFTQGLVWFFSNPPIKRLYLIWAVWTSYRLAVFMLKNNHIYLHTTQHRPPLPSPPSNEPFKTGVHILSGKAGLDWNRSKVEQNKQMLWLMAAQMAAISLHGYKQQSQSPILILSQPQMSFLLKSQWASWGRVSCCIQSVVSWWSVWQETAIYNL